MIFFWEGAGAVDNAPARRKGALGKHHETQISPQWGLCNFLDFPSHFGMKYDRPWNMVKKLLELFNAQSKLKKNRCYAEHVRK